MKKTLLSLCALLVMGIGSAMADVIETVGATDCSSAWTAAKTNLTIEGDGGAHFTFINHNITTNFVYNNFVLEANDGNGNYLDMRADNWCIPNDATKKFTQNVLLNNTYDWSTFMADLNGATVDMYIYKKDTRVLVESTITTTANVTRKYQVQFPSVDAAKLTFYLIVDQSYLEITKSEAVTLPTSVDLSKEIVGYLDYSSAYVGVSGTEYKLDNAGNGKEFKFKNLNNGAADNWKNWILRCFNKDATWSMNFYLRADNAALFADGASWDSDIATKHTFTMDSNFDWTAFPAEMNGATVDLKVWRKDNVVYTDAAIVTSTGKNWTYTFSMSNVTSDNCTVALSQEAALLEVESVTDYSYSPTAISNVNADVNNASVKSLKAGKLVISKNGMDYNAAGARLK